MNIQTAQDEAEWLLGSTREEVRARLGEPDRTGGTSRRHREPRIWCYGPVELHFDLSGRLVRLYADDEEGNLILNIENSSLANNHCT